MTKWGDSNPMWGGSNSVDRAPERSPLAQVKRPSAHGLSATSLSLGLESNPFLKEESQTTEISMKYFFN